MTHPLYGLSRTPPSSPQPSPTPSPPRRSLFSNPNIHTHPTYFQPSARCFFRGRALGPSRGRDSWLCDKIYVKESSRTASMIPLLDSSATVGRSQAFARSANSRGSRISFAITPGHVKRANVERHRPHNLRDSFSQWHHKRLHPSRLAWIYSVSSLLRRRETGGLSLRQTI